MIDPALCLVRPAATSAEDVVRALARLLHGRGHVRDSFERAALAREKRSPTGLPFPGIAVALPHAEPEHVVSPAIAIATLATPVVFREMGSPAVKLSVSLVVMPAFSAKEQAGAGLSALIERLQDEALRARLVAAEDAASLAAALEV
ncbi:MAG: PTS sugar transporter subunit IIA [Myxococcales bacterium]|nr:PTS sugar transporter subunit IIA [Myxococcales bacterium]MBL8718781.1 PTS sugar transporter subunit IIA [Myxococcales bacterium]